MLGEGVHVKSGVQTVMVEVSESQRLDVPHIIKFHCGSYVLLTFPGRPSLCLRCHKLGHIWKDCPVGTRGYATAMSKSHEELVIPINETELLFSEAMPAITDDQTVSSPTVHVTSEKDLDMAFSLLSEGDNGVTPPVVKAEVMFAPQSPDGINLVEMTDKPNKRGYSSSEDSEEVSHQRVDEANDNSNSKQEMSVTQRQLKRERLKSQVVFSSPHFWADDHFGHISLA